MRLSELATRPATSLQQALYKVLCQFLVIDEGVSGQHLVLAIQTGLSSTSRPKTTLSDPQIVAAIARTVQQYGATEDELKQALVQALEYIFSPNGKLSNQTRFVQKPTSQDVKQLYDAVLQGLQKSAP